MKKILILLIAATMSVSVLSACGGSAENTAGEAEIVNEAAGEDSKKVVEGFLDSCIALDLAKMAEYVDIESTEMPFANLAEAKKQIIDEMVEEDGGMTPVISSMEQLIDSMFKSATDVMSYEVGEAEQDGDKYVYPVSFTLVTGDTDIAGKIEEVVAEFTSEEAIMTLATQLLADGKITDTSGEVDVLKAVFDALMPEMVKAVEQVEWETETTEGEIVVVQENGEWVIDTEASIF